jgi:hypothetical protein
MRQRFTFALTAVGAGLALAGPARAEEMIPGGEEEFTIVGGAVLARIDSSVAVDGTVSTGSIIELEVPGVDKEANAFIFGAQWRAGSRHRISGSYFTTRNERSVSFDQSVTIGDDTLVPPTTLTSVSRNRFLLADYRYSFVKNKNVELAGVIGAYVNKFTVELSGTATVQNNSAGTITTATRTVEYRPEVTVPLPLIGASIDWYATPRLKLGGSLAGLKAKIGDIDGGVYVATASAEYMVTRNFGAGLSLMLADLDVDVNKQNFNGQVNWKNENLVGYIVIKF